MGTITSEDESIIMLVQAHVKTEDTDDMGAYDPIEGMARPFPYLATTNGRTAYVESFIQNNELNPLSEEVIEYTSYLYDSMTNREWVDELSSYNDDTFDSVGLEIASGLKSFAVHDPPRTLQRMMYESAYKYMDEKHDNESKLFNNPLVGIEDRERYQFEYLPAPEDVDSWEFKHYHTDVVEDDIRVHTESLWLRYTNGDTTEERPIIIMKNSESSCMAMSPNVSYGDGDETDVPSGLIRAILEKDTDYDSKLVTDDISELNGTRTMEYLKMYS